MRNWPRNRWYPADSGQYRFVLRLHRDAVPLAEGDSRYFIMLSQWQDSAEVDAFKAANPRYYPDLFATLTQSPGALRKWLMDYPLHPD